MAFLYEDEHAILTDMKLMIRNYSFPTKKTKQLMVDHIEIVWFEEQSTCKTSALKTWGKSSADIYWALDVKRCLPNASRWNIVVDYGQKTRIGFTVEDGEEFMEALRCNLDYHVIIVDTINL